MSSKVSFENVAPVQAHEVPAKKVVTSGAKLADGRKKLQTLQPSGNNQKVLVGADGILRLGGSSGKKEIKIYEDPISTSTPERKSPVKSSIAIQASVFTADSQTQVEKADLAEEEMYCREEDLGVEYWRDLAEKRREALEHSLVENEELHTSISILEEEKGKIEEERDSLRSMAEQAEELAKIIKSLVSDDDDDDQDEAIAQSLTVDQSEQEDGEPADPVPIVEKPEEDDK